MRIHSLHLYPVKSLRGCDVTSVEVDALGFAGDRRFLVVDEQGCFLTQRTIPAMATVSTALTEKSLTLSAEGRGSVSVSRAGDPHAMLLPVSVWSASGLLAEDCGDEIADWLTQVLAVRCRLVRIGGRFRRPVTKAAAHAGDLVSFADAAPLLIVSISSLEELNRRIIANHREPVPMDRFRPNLVIEGSHTPFAEEEWAALSIGGVRLRTAGPSERCIMTTTDQHSGRRGVEPLRTLATFRRVADGSAVCFGVNFIQESKSGRLNVGDAVELCAA
ncbi:MOSC domain-containing protein [Prosthecobacter sp.]|uniref:MOSC domain-containing protein n=1 Tax=Prosthecobacter sp. TaxID=1965333 RepID=UPI00378462FF